MNHILAVAAVLGMITTAQAAPPLKQMPIDFVGEWCNGETFEGQTNWKLPSWVDETENGGKCTNILRVTKYSFDMTMGKEDFSCTPDAIRQKEDTAPSGTTYVATINAHCTMGTETGRGLPVKFEFSRYKGNIYLKIK